MKANKLRYKSAKEELKLKQFSLEHASDAMIWIAEDGSLFDVNEAACCSLGYSKEELISMKVWEIDTEFPVEIWSDHWEKMKAIGSMTLESYLIRKDNHIFPVEIKTNFMQFNSREYIFAVFQDITVRKRTQDELQEIEEKYRTILDDIDAGYYEVGLAGEFTYVNKWLLQRIGYASEEMLGKHYDQFMDRENASKVSEFYNEVYHSEQHGRLTEIAIKKDGTKINLDISVSLIKDSTGLLTGFRGIVRDRTED
ncbi:MAG: PAS domain S-box protein [Deltaproteobacteria bacterium]|nr:PAS domain S-box protein [Deltaproteobacteria bacterium]